MLFMIWNNHSYMYKDWIAKSRKWVISSWHDLQLLDQNKCKIRMQSKQDRYRGGVSVRHHNWQKRFYRVVKNCDPRDIVRLVGVTSPRESESCSEELASPSTASTSAASGMLASMEDRRDVRASHDTNCWRKETRVRHNWISSSYGSSVASYSALKHRRNYLSTTARLVRRPSYEMTISKKSIKIEPQSTSLHWI